MLIVHAILAAIAIAALAVRPRSALAALAALAAAGVDVLLGASLAPAVSVVAPLTAFLGAALTLAALVERSGIADRAAQALAARAGGSALALYALVCATCAILTAAVSLDGAVVLIVPLLLVLSRRFGAPFAPLFLGAVVVANAVLATRERPRPIVPWRVAGQVAALVVVTGALHLGVPAASRLALPGLL